MTHPPSAIRHPQSFRPVIGLLGGVASGKSLVASQFAELGCAVVDADRVGHELLCEPSIRDALRERFGPGILDPATGQVDRRRLGEVVFADPVKLQALESVVHPELWRRVTGAVEAARRGDAPAVVLDAALILEKGLDTLCNVLVYIEVPEGTRQTRAGQTRGWDPQEVTRREAAQVSLKTKQNRADYIVDNSTSPEHTLEQVRTILSCLVK